MVIRNREYYTQLDEILRESKQELDYHVKMANLYKDLCKATKNRRGIWQKLHKFARKRNQAHIEKGYEIAKLHMAWCLNQIDYLNKNYF